ncbi:MAG TPA: hypothetical protein PKI03_08210 [Pseudomonadota bacterium]|nr:hypothetical protein [Pseudomonadota bacterium]
MTAVVSDSSRGDSQVSQAAPSAPRTGRLTRLGTTVGAASALLGLTACTTMQSYIGRNAAHKPPAASSVQPVTPAGSPALKLWAGDANFQLPEGDFKASLDLPKVLETIKKSGLDFVFFNPAVKSRFYDDQSTLDNTVQRWREMRQFLETIPDPKPLFLPGLQVVDKNNGTVSLLFLDLPTMTVDLKSKNFRQSPQLFFYSAKAFGALLFIDTPFATPVKVPVEGPDRFTSVDRSWRPITDGARDPKTFPPEIAAAEELAYGMEAYSIPVSVWRDQYGLDDPLFSLHATMRRMDDEILRRKRRMVPIAGSDSRQGKHLHPTMFIAAPSRTPQALREGLLRGRVCIRSPEPCAVRVYVDDEGLPQGVGASLRAKQRIELRWQGEGEVIRNGESYGAFDGRATVPAESQCTVLRLVVDGGYSAPIYVNCPFADMENLP